MSQELCNELSCLYYEFDNNGAYQIESKKAAKLRGVGSPNIADALVISEYFHSFAHKLFLTKDKIELLRKNKERQKRKMDRMENRSHLWMAVG